MSSRGPSVTMLRGGEPVGFPLEFVSDAGDRVTRDVLPLDEDAWPDLNEAAWRAILHDTGGGQGGEVDVWLPRPLPRA